MIANKSATLATIVFMTCVAAQSTNGECRTIMYLHCTGLTSAFVRHLCCLRHCDGLNQHHRSHPLGCAKRNRSSYSLHPFRVGVDRRCLCPQRRDIPGSLSHCDAVPPEPPGHAHQRLPLALRVPGRFAIAASRAPARYAPSWDREAASAGAVHRRLRALRLRLRTRRLRLHARRRPNPASGGADRDDHHGVGERDRGIRPCQQQRAGVDVRAGGDRKRPTLELERGFLAVVVALASGFVSGCPSSKRAPEHPVSGAFWFPIWANVVPAFVAVERCVATACTLFRCWQVKSDESNAWIGH